MARHDLGVRAQAPDDLNGDVGELVRRIRRTATDDRDLVLGC
jgi:hypothetical protein